MIIKRRGGEIFIAPYRERSISPFDVPGIDTNATTQDTLDAIRESRSGYRMASSDVEDAE